MVAENIEYMDDYKAYALPITFIRQKEKERITDVKRKLRAKSHLYIGKEDSTFLDDYLISGYFNQKIGKPRLKNSVLKGGVGVVEKNDEEILEEMLAADAGSSRLVYETNEEMIEFIHLCEKVYLKNTAKHLEDYKENEFEGNVDEDRWYRFATYLLKEGYTISQITSGEGNGNSL
ncbi:hypothetical protein ACSBO6_18650 [Bacillus sp. AL-1R]